MESTCTVFISLIVKKCLISELEYEHNSSLWIVYYSMLVGRLVVYWVDAYASYFSKVLPNQKCKVQKF